MFTFCLGAANPALISIYIRSFWSYATGNGDQPTYLMDKIDPNTGAILSETVLPTETFFRKPLLSDVGTDALQRAGW